MTDKKSRRDKAFAARTKAKLRRMGFDNETIGLMHQAAGSLEIAVIGAKLARSFAASNRRENVVEALENCQDDICSLHGARDSAMNRALCAAIVAAKRGWGCPTKFVIRLPKRVKIPKAS